MRDITWVKKQGKMKWVGEWLGKCVYNEKNKTLVILGGSFQDDSGIDDDDVATVNPEEKIYTLAREALLSSLSASLPIHSERIDIDVICCDNDDVVAYVVSGIPSREVALEIERSLPQSYENKEENEEDDDNKVVRLFWWFWEKLFDCILFFLPKSNYEKAVEELEKMRERKTMFEQKAKDLLGKRFER